MTYLPLCSLMQLLLLLLHSCCCQSCPKPCSCNFTTVRCCGIDLREIPENINNNVTTLDLSDNPSLHIHKLSFVRFHGLKILFLNNCSVSAYFLLPRSLSELHLEQNRLTANLIKYILKDPPKTLFTLNLQGNHIHFQDGLDAIPRQLKHLDLSQNVLPIITPDYFRGFHNLQRASFRDSKISRILPHAFDQLHNLVDLELQNNKLKCLPPLLFGTTPKLRRIKLNQNKLSGIPDLRGVRLLKELDLSENRIRNVTSESFGMGFILVLILRGNQIETFELDKLKYLKLDLSHNKITELKADSFGGRKDITQILLHNNRLKKMSPFAFRGTRWILELYLQNNKLRRIEEGTFREMSINKLILYGNDLDTIDRVFDDMRVPPKLVLLFGNPRLTTLRGASFQSLTNRSVVCINCKNLKVMTKTFLIRSQIKCMPTEDLNIDTPSTVLSDDGFHCRYSAKVRQYQCYPCPVGHYGYCKQDKFPCSGSCKACPPGSFFQDELAKKQCKVCPVGQFVPPGRAPGKTPLDCLTCPVGTNTTSSAGFRACPCLKGYSRRYRFGKCEKCPKVGFSCKRDYPELKRGYWMTWLSNDTCRKSYKNFMWNLEIKNDSYDRKTTILSCDMPMPHKCPVASSCLGGTDANCSAGYTGVLCAVCAKGFNRGFNRCVRCPKSWVALFQLVGYAALFIALCFLISWADKITMHSHKNKEVHQKVRAQKERTFADIILSTLKILLGFYQVLDGILNASAWVKWPRTLKKAIRIFEYLQFNIIHLPSIRCIRPDLGMNAISEFWLSVFATVAFPIVAVVYFAVMTLWYKLRSARGSRAEKRKKCWRNCLRAVALFMFATYPLTSKKIVQILPLSCHTFCVAGGRETGGCIKTISYLRGDYSVSCPIVTSSNQGTLIAAYVALVIPLGFPVLLFILLWRFARPSILKPTAIYPIAINEPYADDPSGFQYLPLFSARKASEEGAMQSALKFAYENYNSTCWYWEVIEMARKLIMTVGITLFLQHTKVGLGGIIIIAISFTTLQAIKNPIKDPFENFLQLLSLSIVPINVSVGTVLQSKQVGDSEIIDAREDSWALGVVLVALNSLLVILVLGRFFRAIFKKLCGSKRRKRLERDEIE